MTPQALKKIAHDPTASAEEKAKALRFALKLIDDYEIVCARQETTGTPHYLIRIDNKTPQLTVTGPEAEVEEHLCELVAAYAHMQGLQIGDPDAAAKAALKEAYAKGMRDTVVGVYAAILAVCPDRFQEIKAEIARMAKEEE